MTPSPTSADIDNAEVDEAEALSNFIRVSKKSTTVSLEVIAAHKKLSLARAHKRAVIQDLLKYGTI